MEIMHENLVGAPLVRRDVVGAQDPSASTVAPPLDVTVTGDYRYCNYERGPVCLDNWMVSAHQNRYKAISRVR